MSHLNDYLAEKRAAVLARNAAVDAGSAQPLQLKASVKAEGRSGVALPDALERHPPARERPGAQ